MDSKAAFTARQQKGKKYSSGETYWVAASATPRTALEVTPQPIATSAVQP